MSLRAQTPARKRKDKKKSLFCKSCTKQGFLGVKKEEVHNIDICAQSVIIVVEQYLVTL